MAVKQPQRSSAMKEDKAASVQEFAWQWQRTRPVAQPTEVEQAMAAWRQQRSVQGRRTWRETIARGLLVLAAQLAPTVAVDGAAAAQ
jgi:hypothetical protein